MSSRRRASPGSSARRRVKLSSMLADKGTAAGSPNPPASWIGVSPRGSSNRASGLPRVSRTIRSSTCSSSASGQDGLQQRPRITTPQGLDAKLRQSREHVAQLTSREHERDLLRQQAAGHERKRPRRRTIEPLRVIDDAQQRLLLAKPRTAGRGPPVRPGTDSEPARRSARRRRRARRAGDPADAPIGRGSASTAVEAPRTGAPSPPRPRRSVGPATPAPSSTVQSSSAVFPTPGSPCTTRTPPSPPRAAASRRPSASRSRSRPSRWAAGGLVSVPASEGEPIYGDSMTQDGSAGHSGRGLRRSRIRSPTRRCTIVSMRSRADRSPPRTATRIPENRPREGDRR